MKSTARIDFDLISQAMKESNTAKATALLSKVDVRNLEPDEPSCRSEYYFLHAWIMYSTGEFGRALSLVKGALRLCQRTSDHLLFAREKQLQGLVYLAQGRPALAIESFTEAYVSRKRAGDYRSIYSSFVNLSLAHFACGDLRQAWAVLQNALSFAKKHNSAAEMRLCQLNRCLVAFFSGDFREFRASIDSIRSQPLGVMDTAHVTKHLGQLAAFMLDHESARESLKQALVVYARCHIQREHAICLEFLGMNEYFAGNYQKAKEYYEQVLAMPEPTASAVAQSLRMLADVYIAEKDWKRAKETAAKAEVAITKINERIELGALWRAQAQIAEHDGDTKAARALLEKSLELLQQCGARYELALTHLAAGQSQCLDHAQRCEHLSEAKALFVEMDVPNRVTQVDLVAIEENSRFAIPSRSRKAQDKERVIITRDRQLQEILRKVERARDSNLTVLITGETGTGKDLLAEYIHGTSLRAKGPYVNMNMAVLPDSLIESELFGFTRGSFTGATDNKLGLIESADGGTFCFNEIAEILPAMQAKLLKVLEARSVRRLGAMREREVNVRFIAITNRDLPAMIKQNLFREDLYQRLAQVVFHLPPLRERVEDIPVLFQHFVQRLGISLTKITPTYYQELLDRLCERHWQGNVRELYTFTQHLATLNGDLTDIAIQELIILLSKKR